MTLFTGLSGYGQSSVLQSGNWYKLGVAKNGVYKITYSQLKKTGIDPAKTDPRTIKIYGREGGMLPQSNAVARPTDLLELSIFVSGESDGVFNKEDYILFYAEGPESISFLPEKQIFEYESNLYSDKNYYFITSDESAGRRIVTNETGDGGEPVTTFDDFIYHEKDERNELTSGREWFGEYFSITNTHTFNFSIEGIVENSPMRFVSDVVGQSFNSTSMQIHLNNILIGDQSLPTISNSTYAQKGRHRRDTLLFNANTAGAASTTNQQIKYSFQPAATGSSRAYLDFFLMSFKRNLALYGDQTIFRAGESLDHGLSRYQIQNINAGTEVWNITNPYEPIRQNTTLQNNAASFTSHGEGTLQEFIVFNTKIAGPEFIEKVPNQNLRSLSTPHYIIISHPDFLQQATRLANHRSSNGVTTAVVTPQEIYNEFSSGRQDVTALRDFVKHLYDKSPATLKALLLFGKCSYDYKNRITPNTNFVPTYESRNSLSPLETYSSDDYFAFLENTEGSWNEAPITQNHTLDIGVGRLPVKTAEEAGLVVDKIIDYEVNSKMLGRWRKDIVFVADDGSASDGFTSIHQAQANAMAENIEAINPDFNTRKIFLGAYTKTVTPTGEVIPKAVEDIIEEFDDAVIINYTGHGSEEVLADEDVVTKQIIQSLRNKTYPFLVTATCEFGRHDNPKLISSAEVSVLRQGGGAIGLVTTARPVNSSTNFSLNQAFYQALFQKENNQYLTLGEVFRRTKNNSISGVSNRNFSLLADPMLTLTLPSLNLAVQNIKTATGSDTLKALSKVIIQGEVQAHDGTRHTTFNGTLEATLFDKRTKFITVGKNNPAFEFEQWFNPLFRGKATVTSGTFELEFILPKNIVYEVNPGKLSLYAFDPVLKQDGTGSTSNFKIGESEPDPPNDFESPHVIAYIGDSTFVNGGVAKSNTTLVVRVKDQSGINISNYGIGNTMMATLNQGDEVFTINEYYVADKDDFTQGWIHYPLYNLSPGKHTITVNIWDTYNNPGQATVDFIVTDENQLVVENFGNYPNPFDGETTLFFTHNRSGEDLEVSVVLLDMAGQQLKNFYIAIPSSSYQVNVYTLNAINDFGKKLPQGIYFARLAVRSLTDGSKSDRVTKLIVVN